MDKVKTKVYKSGNSQAITLQQSILKDAKINIGDEIVCYVENGRIILEKNDQSFKTRWDNFIKNGGSYDEKEINWGEPVGRELW